MVINKSNRRYENNNSVKPIKMVMDISTFNILCRYVISSSSYIRINQLINLGKLIDALEPSTYNNDPDKIKRIAFIRRGLDARIKYKLTNPELIISHIMNGIEYDIDFINWDSYELNSDEIQWVHNLISESIKYFFVFDSVDNLLDIGTRIKSSDYNHRGDLINELEGFVDDLKNKFRSANTEDNLTDMTFSLREGVFDEAIKETYDLISNPSRRLICGMQGLNEMIGGGFESGRVYMFLGITGIGKSFTLLNLIYQLKRYNRGYRTKDPTKTPCIVLLTMENTVVETITRLFDLSVEGSLSMSNYTIDEVLSKLRNEGELVLDSESPIDIVIRYKANRSVDTSYLYSLCEDLEDDGYEVICLIQDHVKRIRSIYNANDIRIELGDVVNELKVFAAYKDIPVITNCHLNRDAAKTIEEGNAKSSPTDVTMKLGKSNVGESLLMLDNIDCAIIINIDFDENNNKYMVFSIIKMRDKTDRTYIAQPFMYGSSIRMVEDVGGVPMFRERLHTKELNRSNNSIRTSSSSIMSNMNNIVSPNTNSINSFSNINNAYSFSSYEEEMDNQSDDMISSGPEIIQPFIFIKDIRNSDMSSGLEDLKSKLNNLKKAQ